MEESVLMIRLDKYLADMGIGTRTEVKKFIRSGRIQVDGRIEKKPELKVDTATQQITFDNTPVVYQEYEYYMPVSYTHLTLPTKA